MICHADPKDLGASLACGRPSVFTIYEHGNHLSVIYLYIQGPKILRVEHHHHKTSSHAPFYCIGSKCLTIFQFYSLPTLQDRSLFLRESLVEVVGSY